MVVVESHGVDWLNPAGAESLWGPFLERMGGFVPDTFRGYVQDELDVLSGDVVWSESLLERFVADCGYDPRPGLVGLFF